MKYSLVITLFVLLIIGISCSPAPEEYDVFKLESARARPCTKEGEPCAHLRCCKGRCIIPQINNKFVYETAYCKS